MASEATIKNFIEEIAPCAQKAYRTLGKIKPSICIGMACVESAYGTSKIMRQHNAFFGQKVGTGKTATKYWSGKFFTSKTKEEYTIGTHSVIKAAFRSYPEGMQQSVFNYYELLNTSLYKRVKADADYVTQMQQIKLCGYMTSSTEVNSVIQLINKYNLTKYDDVRDELKEAQSVCPYTRTCNLIKRGMKGKSVKWLQWHLVRHGANLKIDGDFGKLTLTAVINFQQTHPPLKVDGLVGPKTIAELEK